MIASTTPSPHDGSSFIRPDDIVENWQKYALIISHRLPFDEALEALALAATPGAADKVTVVFD